MMAIEAREFGGPEVLTLATLPAPVPGPGEAVIAVSAADVLFLDTMIRSGLARDAFPQRPPYIPGNGAAGRVAAVGEIRMVREIDGPRDDAAVDEDGLGQHDVGKMRTACEWIV